MDCLRNYDVKDNRITELSRAYRIKLGTGWYTPAGVIHAPASVVTFEPQWNSDVNTIMENVTMGEVNPHNLLQTVLQKKKKMILKQSSIRSTGKKVLVRIIKKLTSVSQRSNHLQMKLLKNGLLMQMIM